MRDIALIVLAVVAVGALSLVGYLARSAHRQVKATAKYLDSQQRELRDARRELRDARQELAAHMNAVKEILYDGRAVPDDEPERHPRRRDRWLKSVPPLAVLFVFLAWLRSHAATSIPVASVAASAGILGMIVIGASPEGAGTPPGAQSPSSPTVTHTTSVTPRSIATGTSSVTVTVPSGTGQPQLTAELNADRLARQKSGQSAGSATVSGRPPAHPSTTITRTTTGPPSTVTRPRPPSRPPTMERLCILELEVLNIIKLELCPQKG